MGSRLCYLFRKRWDLHVTCLEILKCMNFTPIGNDQTNPYWGRLRLASCNIAVQLLIWWSQWGLISYLFWLLSLKKLSKLRQSKFYRPNVVRTLFCDLEKFNLYSQQFPEICYLNIGFETLNCSLISLCSSSYRMQACREQWRHWGAGDHRPRVLSTGHFSWTRPGEKLTRPAIADKKSDQTRPDPRPDPSPICGIFNWIIIYLFSAKNLSRIQRIQNTLARVDTCSRSRSSSAPLLKHLHRLPVSARIHFKIALLTFKSLHTIAPSYLSSLICPYVPLRALRSSSAQRLCVPHVSSVFGSRGFRSAGPAIWNSLPLSFTTCSTIHTFKKQLKTHHLFASAFPSSWIASMRLWLVVFDFVRA